jgi:poly-beta-1,6-N-acetyl-D-glucosamine synthase
MINAFIIILSFVVVVYVSLLTWLAVGFIFTPNYYITSEDKNVSVTIIICARNEERFIGNCLASIIKQDYDFSHVRLIVINDASIDNTVHIAEQILKKTTKLDYEIITNLQQKGKKKSLDYAVTLASTELIITRDADTFTTSTMWLQTIANFYFETKSDFIIGPVAISSNIGLLWALQAIENNIIALCMAGSAWYKKSFLCSGANLIFTKKIFNEVNGYSSHIHISSGDDVLLMEDTKKTSHSQISYLKSEAALVYTYPQRNFSELIAQKTRWASKFKVNPNPLNSIFAVFIFLTNLCWLAALVYGFAYPLKSSFTLIFILTKMLIDTLLLFLASRFLNNKLLLWYALPIGFVYPIYSCIIALGSLFRNGKWKN